MEPASELMYAHLSHAFRAQRRVCDAMGEHARRSGGSGGRRRLRWRNTFSHADANRDSAMAEALYWKMRAVTSGLSEKFVQGGRREASCGS